jgi:hypothetical protein
LPKSHKEVVMPKRSLALVLSLAVAIATGMAVLLYPSDAYAANCPGPSLYCGIYGEITAACYYVEALDLCKCPIPEGQTNFNQCPDGHWSK